MGDRWLNPTEESPRTTTLTERGELLVQLLELADALPPVPHTELDAPTFQELCEPR